MSVGARTAGPHFHPHRITDHAGWPDDAHLTRE